MQACRSQPRLPKWFASITPPSSAAALEPHPMPRGISFRIFSLSGSTGRPAWVNTSRYVSKIMLLPGRAQRSALRPAASMVKIGPSTVSDTSALRVSVSPMASPTVSNPGPRLADVAGRRSVMPPGCWLIRGFRRPPPRPTAPCVLPAPSAPPPRPRPEPAAACAAVHCVGAPQP